MEPVVIRIAGKRTSYTPPNILVGSLLPTGRGQAQEHIRQAAQQVFGVAVDSLPELAAHYRTTPSAVITFALTYQAGMGKVFAAHLAVDAP